VRPATFRIVALSILGSVTLLPILILPTMVGALIDHADFSDSQAGWVVSVGFVGSALGAIVIGLRIHHFNPRVLALVGVLALALFDVLSAAVGSIPTSVFLSFRFLSGLGGAIAYAAVLATIAASDEPEKGYGIFMAFQFAFSAIGLYGLPFVLPWLQATGMYLVLAGLAAAALTLVSSVLVRKPHDAIPAAVEVSIVAKPAALSIMLAIGLFEAANFMHFTYAERIGLSFDLSHRQVGETLGVATLIGIPAGFAVAWMGERFGQLKPLLISLGLSVAGLTGLLVASSAATYVVAMCTIGFAWALGLPFFQAVEARLDRGGSVVVLGSFFTACGSAIGPALAATLVRPGSFDAVLSVAVAVYLIVAVLTVISTLAMSKATIR